jgi:hypothetical protein
MENSTKQEAVAKASVFCILQQELKPGFAPQ